MAYTNQVPPSAKKQATFIERVFAPIASVMGPIMGIKKKEYSSMDDIAQRHPEIIMPQASDQK